MSQNVTIAGTNYNSVPSVQIPKQTSGTATFYDVSDTTAAAANVEQGYYFYTSAGVKTQGTLRTGAAQVQTTTKSNSSATATVNVSGGGDFKYCEVTVVSPSEGQVSGLTPANAEGILITEPFRVNNGDKIKCYYTLDEGDIVATLGAHNPDATLQASDYVNCEPIEEGVPYVIITDPTENSAFTLTVTNWGGGI